MFVQPILKFYLTINDYIYSSINCLPSGIRLTSYLDSSNRFYENKKINKNLPTTTPTGHLQAVLAEPGHPTVRFI